MVEFQRVTFHTNLFPSRSSLPTLKKYFLLASILGCLVCLPITEGRYRCALKDFIRLGNSCYFLSAEIASWQEAHFRCRDRDAQLAVLASHYEDSTLRSYLERPEFAQLGRWIGGMWASKWIWAAQGVDIENEGSFVSNEVINLQETDQWMCLYMDPNNRYRWNSQNCMLYLHYICEAPLARVTNGSAHAEHDSPSSPDLTLPGNNETTSQPTLVVANETDGETDFDMDLISETVEEINLPTTQAEE